MSDADRSVDKLLASLQERAKELNCLYEVERVLNEADVSLDEAFQAVADAIPPGWQYPDICRAKIEYGGSEFTSPDFEESSWLQRADVVVQDEIVGTVTVYYLEERPREDVGPFLEEEERLIRTIADRLAHGILYHQLRAMRREWESTSHRIDRGRHEQWRGPVELLRRSDRDLYLQVTRKMLNHLCWIGVEGAQELLQEIYGRPDVSEQGNGEQNIPGRSGGIDMDRLLSGSPFELASIHLSNDEILGLVQKWVVEDKASFLPKVLHNPRTTLSEVSEALQRFHHLVADGAELPESTLNGYRVSLIRRFLTEQLEFINVAKQYVETSDFLDVIDKVILSSIGHGRLGGKSSGLFLAEKILRHRSVDANGLGQFKIPKSWYLPSECVMRFIEFNDLEEVLQQKYKSDAQVRQEYPNIVQLFKNSRMPSDVEKGLAIVLDELENRPVIVRSSSLLEDRLGSAFSGKYKSLFLANQGSREERLAALTDAIAEVYASVFGPDPIAYRRARGLLDFHEEMGILIQEVVGRRVGRYFFPAVGGVAFSNNEFRWSPRIRREDGLIRMVPGLGTRAVDRLSDDYPILAVPGQPNLKVNASLEEVVRYSPAKVDVIDLDNNTFTTRSLRELVTECGTDFPGFSRVFSAIKDGRLERVNTLMYRAGEDDLVADMEGLIQSTGFVAQVGGMLHVLQESLRTPVDIEFAYDGTDFYLLQCRPQSYSEEEAPAPIPKDIPEGDVVFVAERHVSNGWVPDLSHVVYVDPVAYQNLESREEMLAVGQAVGELNKLLPKRQFVLMGPGRWGSRGDIRLGVSVTYSDIDNTALLIEIARKKGRYRPDLSFGTHFFQDLVESSIRYLPLYPDDDGVLNERFLATATNLLPQVLPRYGWLADVIKVIEVATVSRGRRLRVLMNSELDRAVGFLADVDEVRTEPRRGARDSRPAQSDVFWRWRLRMAERIAAELDPQRFGVEAMYVIGSTKNATAGPNSDIDLLVHFRGHESQRGELLNWLEGWSLALSEVNFQRTGYTSAGLLDVHLVTDEDIERQTSYAAKIGAVTDAARELTVRGSESDQSTELPE